MNDNVGPKSAALSDTYIEQPKPYSRTGSVFGARKKRNLHSFSGYSSSSASTQNHGGSSKLKDQAVLLQPKVKLSPMAMQSSPTKMMDRLESSERRHADVGAKGFDQQHEHGKSNGDDTEDPVGTSRRALAPLLLAGKTEKEFEGRAKAASKPKSSGMGNDVVHCKICHIMLLPVSFVQGTSMVVWPGERLTSLVWLMKRVWSRSACRSCVPKYVWAFLFLF